MLWPYALKDFSEQWNVLKVDDDGITPMEKFSGTTADIFPKNHHTWGCPFMSWMHNYKEIYLNYPSGDHNHMQGSILVTHHFMQDK